MTRIKISVCILCVLVGISVFSAIWTNQKCSSMLGEIDVIFQLMDNDENTQAEIQARKLNSNWSDFRKKAVIFLQNDELTQIDCISSGIPYLISKNNDESYARLTEMKHMLASLKDEEIPALKRIL